MFFSNSVFTSGDSVGKLIGYSLLTIFVLFERITEPAAPDMLTHIILTTIKNAILPFIFLSPLRYIFLTPN